jgi:hypothetical protein
MPCKLNILLPGIHIMKIIKPILIDLPMPIITSRLLIRPPQIGDGVALNAAIIESFNTHGWGKINTHSR